MGLLFHVSVIDDFGFPEGISAGYIDIEVDYSLGCSVFANTFLSDAQNNVPVDTGFLLSTLVSSNTDDEITCQTDCEYAQYVEFGTYKMSAQPYFIPALEAALDAAIPLWMAAIEEAQETAQEILAQIAESEAEEEEEEEEGIWIEEAHWAEEALGETAKENGEGPFTGGGGFLPDILGTILAAIIVGFIDVFLDTFFNPGKFLDEKTTSGGIRSGIDVEGVDEVGIGGLMDIIDIENFVEVI